MANAKKKDIEEIRKENAEATVSSAEKFYNENKKLIWGVVCAVIVIGLGILGYQKFIYQPKCAEAMQQCYPAEINFQKGEYELALNGDGNTLGFAQIISDYGTKAGKAVYLYAGVCELQLGNYESALGYLKKYNGKDSIMKARAIGCQGDAYVGLEDYNQGIACFEKAAAAADNVFAATYLFKAGQVYEKIGDNDSALRCYREIKDRYPQSLENYNIDSYIARIEAL
ncbi:MAG: tetratricopeptide repeat protein [Bacteroidales bacterium]|nr:tetratricopeptide repeat protein [Bacteroidales bacterium]